MVATDWDQIFEIFHAARAKSGQEREVLLDSACGENTVFRKAVEELLKHDEVETRFLATPLFSRITGQSVSTHIHPGQRFGRYLTVELIGRGGIGEVWSAEDTDLDRRVALKFLSNEALAGLDPHQINREAKAASALNHPGIVTIHEVVQSDSTFAIVMELVEGVPLREVCGKPTSTSDMLAIGAHIAEALAAAHAGGTIHGDIKPENILLRRDQYVKLVDFGLARKLTTESIASGIPALGTLRYLSPEQARGEALTPATDVFSFGLVLYELATGQHAFPALSPLDTTEAILKKEPLPPSAIKPSLPAPLDWLVLAMLSKDPAARPTAAEVAARLAELEAREKSSPRSTAPATWKWGLVAAVLLAVLLSVWRWTLTRHSGDNPTLRQITTLVPENRATAAAISPDGKRAAYANQDGVFIRAMGNGATIALRAPMDLTVDRLSWFPDGTKLVASGFSTTTYIPSVWIISATGAPPRLIRTMARQGSPSPDGAHVAFTNKDRSAIWVVGVNGEKPRKLLGATGGDSFPLVFWSANGHWLAFERRHYSAKLDRPNRSLDRYYKQSYESLALDTGKVVVSVPDIWIGSAAVLPNGRMLFLKWNAPGSDDSQQLWEVKTDVTTGAFVGSPRRIMDPVGQSDIQIFGMSATRDGKLVMVIREFDESAVFVGDFALFPPRITGVHRLTLDERTNYPHAWTRDSRAVIFESNRNGTFDLFKQYIDRRMPQEIVATPLTEMLPQLSPDGRFVLYEARAYQIVPGPHKLMRVPVEGGTPQEVPTGGPLDEFRCALQSRGRCVLRTTFGREYYVYYQLDPVTGRGRELARTKWIPGILGDWDVSPDGKYVALPNHDSHDARIRVLALESGSNDLREREVVLTGLTNIRGVVWSANGCGWFVSVDTTVGHRLLYVYRDGHFTSLGDIQGWAVPSPDGRRVAFLDRVIASNAWLIDRR